MPISNYYSECLKSTLQKSKLRLNLNAIDLGFQTTFWWAFKPKASCLNVVYMLVPVWFGNL